MSKPSSKFQIIHNILQDKQNVLSIEELCSISGVSRSGYYNWINSEAKRLEKEAQDRKDFELILEAYKYRGYDKGIRGIHMRLLRGNPSVRMNVKKIQRLMKKYGLLCPIRKANPYRRMARELKSNNYADNLVNREFENHGQEKYY